jgi:hypothetical protein
MDIFGIHFHSWKPIMQNQVYFFRGHECQNSVTSGFRICKDCEKIQQYFYDSQGGCWETMSECEQKIIKDEILFTAGQYQFLKIRDLRTTPEPPNKL